MAKNIAAQRHAKELRRKAALAERRKTEAAANSPFARVARASLLPIQYSMISSGLFGVGLGSLSLARGPTKGNVTWSMFLLDVHCMGIKDVFVRELVGPEVDRHLTYLEVANPVTDIRPQDARKLLHELAKWSGALGFRPHKDYALAEALYGDVDAASSSVGFQFGMDGKPNYVPAPDTKDAIISRDMATLTAAVGVDGFTYILPVRGNDLVGEDDWDTDLDEDGLDDDPLTIDGIVEPEQSAVGKEPAP
jgi:hypothetical protein